MTMQFVPGKSRSSYSNYPLPIDTRILLTYKHIGLVNIVGNLKACPGL
jgi:hypothetical protein